MSRVGLLDHVRGEGTDGVDAFELEGRSFVGRQLGHLVVRLLVKALRGGLVYHYFVVLIPTSLESLASLLTVCLYDISFFGLLSAGEEEIIIMDGGR